MILCFDIGGTTMKGGRARAVDDIEVLERVPTPGHDFDAFVAVLARAIADCPEPPQALALAIPGIIEPGSGNGILANVPCLSGIPVGERLQAALGLPVILANDADCFALAEVAVGAGRGHRVVFGIILGTGVGGGLVIDGRLINAEGGFAGEWGHGPLAARIAGDPPVGIPRFTCGCGLCGCLDATVSARGMERLHRYLHGSDATSLAIIADWDRGEARSGPHHRRLARADRGAACGHGERDRRRHHPRRRRARQQHQADRRPRRRGARTDDAPLRPAAGRTGALPDRARAGGCRLARLCLRGRHRLTRHEAAMKMNYMMARLQMVAVDAASPFRQRSEKELRTGVVA